MERIKIDVKELKTKAKNNGLTRITLDVDNNQALQLRHICAQMNCSRSELIRKVISAFIDIESYNNSYQPVNIDNHVINNN